MKTKSVLPSRTISNWIIGWKAANLLYQHSTGSPCFLQVAQYGIIKLYGADDRAECCLWGHDAPAKDCRCGFNAFHEQQDARNFMEAVKRSDSIDYDSSNLVLMRVGLYGHVIEGTYESLDATGYKAEKQRLANVLIPRTCAAPKCQSRAEVLGITEPNDAQFYDCSCLRPLCRRHIVSSKVRLTLEGCSTRLNAPVIWDEI